MFIIDKHLFIFVTAFASSVVTHEPDLQNID